MDRTDLALSRLLLLDSRTSFRDLADQMDLSVPVVHARVRALQKIGVIRAFNARISLAYLAAPTVIAFGPTQVPDPAELYERVGEEEHTWWTATAGGDFLYVGGYLRAYDELDAYAAFVVKEAGITRATVGLVAPPSLPAGHGESFRLDRSDYRILKSLAKDSRRPVSAIAEEVGLSAKTTARHLDRIRSEGAADFSIDWYPDASDDILPVFHLRLRPGEDKHRATSALLNRYGAECIILYAFSNLPDQLLGIFWTNTMKGLKTLHARLREEPFVEAVMANVMYTGRLFDTWRDTLVTVRAGAQRGGADPRREPTSTSFV